MGSASAGTIGCMTLGSASAGPTGSKDARRVKLNRGENHRTCRGTDLPIPPLRDGGARDLNENIYQATVNLAGEWEKLESSQAAGRTNIDTVSQPRVPVLVQLARSRDLTFLLQPHLSLSGQRNFELGSYPGVCCTQVCSPTLRIDKCTVCEV